MTDPLVYARAIHFAATIAATGVVLFVVFVLDPAARSAADAPHAVKTLRMRLAVIAWISLALSLVSGAVWLMLTAASMSGQSVADAVSPDMLWTVLSQTTFGNDWLLRLVLACGLAGVFIPLFSADSAKPKWLKAAAVVLAAAFMGSTAWAGHAIGGRGLEGVLHPAADALHLIAAAAWLGTLVPLALLLGSSTEHVAELATMRAATLRFSTLGLVSVGTLLCTGIVNTWYLAGSIPALLGTDYGRLLLLKIALFLSMVGIAVMNRLRLTPALIKDSSITGSQGARRQLCRNAATEASIGAIVIGIVAVLGALPPAGHGGHHVMEQALSTDISIGHIHSK